MFLLPFSSPPPKVCDVSFTPRVIELVAFLPLSTLPRGPPLRPPTTYDPAFSCLHEGHDAYPLLYGPWTFFACFFLPIAKISTSPVSLGGSFLEEPRLQIRFFVRASCIRALALSLRSAVFLHSTLYTRVSPPSCSHDRFSLVSIVAFLPRPPSLYQSSSPMGPSPPPHPQYFQRHMMSYPPDSPAKTPSISSLVHPSLLVF